MEQDIENFIKQTKAKNLNLDKELDELMDDDEDLKELKNKNKGQKGKTSDGII